MKALLYVLAIAAIGAGGWFSYDAMNKFTALKADRLELDKSNANRKASIVDAKKDVKAMEAKRDAAKAKLYEVTEELNTVESVAKLSKRQVANWKSKIAEQTKKLQEVQGSAGAVKDAFAELGPDVELDEIPALAKKLEDALKEATQKQEELEEYTVAADKRIAANNAQIEELQSRIAKRAKRIAGNSAQGKVTAVNHDWGFAIINIPSNMPVNEESQLVIKRGSAYVGTLKVDSLEGTRIVADVDYKNMGPGMVIQPGDSVVLARPATN